MKQQDECQTIYADNRTYVWTAAVLEKGTASLFPFCPDDGRRGAHKYGHWIRLLNVDEPPKTPKETHTDISNFEQEWAKERTYHRWEQAGTWYGFSYHSGVLMGSAIENPSIVHHFRDLYFDMAILLFYVRVTLFRFSKELSEIARKKGGKQAESYQEFRKKFVLFSILYRFPLLSNQQQAVEMYTVARKYFDIDELYHEVKEKIDTAHQLEEMKRQAHATNRIEILTKRGIPIGVAAVVASVFGVNLKQYSNSEFNGIVFFVIFLIIVAGVAASYWWVILTLDKDK